MTLVRWATTLLKPLRMVVTEYVDRVFWVYVGFASSRSSSHTHSRKDRNQHTRKSATGTNTAAGFNHLCVPLTQPVMASSWGTVVDTGQPCREERPTAAQGTRSRTAPRWLRPLLRARTKGWRRGSRHDARVPTQSQAL